MSLNKANITLVDPMNELIDQIWITGRAPRPNDVLEIHNITYSGQCFPIAYTLYRFHKLIISRQKLFRKDRFSATKDKRCIGYHICSNCFRRSSM